MDNYAKEAAKIKINMMTSGTDTLAELARLQEINRELVQLCQEIADDTTHPIKGDFQARLREALSRAKEGR
jgi:hypothetical protein